MLCVTYLPSKRQLSQCPKFKCPSVPNVLKVSSRTDQNCKICIFFFNLDNLHLKEFPRAPPVHQHIHNILKMSDRHPCKHQSWYESRFSQFCKFCGCCRTSTLGSQILAALCSNLTRQCGWGLTSSNQLQIQLSSTFRNFPEIASLYLCLSCYGYPPHWVSTNPT